MDNNSYIKPLRPSREIKIVISVCFLLAGLCDRGGCVFVRGCGAVTFSGASRCVPLRCLRAGPGPPGARAAADRGREPAWDGPQGTRSGLGAGGAARARQRSPGAVRAQPRRSRRKLPGSARAAPARPRGDRSPILGPAEPGGKGGRWHRDPRPASPRDGPDVSGRGGSGSSGGRPGDTAGHLRAPSPASRAPRRGGGLLGTPALPALLPRGCGARGAPAAAAGGPELRGLHGAPAGTVPAPFHLSRGRCVPLRHRHVPRSGAGSGRVAPLAAAATRVLRVRARDPLGEQRVRGAARTELPERPRRRARLPAPGGESAATCPGPGPPPPPPPPLAVPGPGSPRPQGPAGQRGQGFPGRVGPRGRRWLLGPCRGWVPPLPGPGARRDVAQRGAQPRAHPPAGPPGPPVSPRGRGSRTCPAGRAAPRQPVGAVLSHAWGGSGAARAPLPAPPCPAPARPLPASLPGRAAPIPRPRR